jgi:hypothetical protein
MYMQRTTSGAAGNGLYTTIKYMRGASGIGMVPPSAPERTLQASGQGQAIARPHGRPTLLLRACTIYALGGECREPAAEDKLCVPVPRQAHTRTHAYVCNPMRSS